MTIITPLFLYLNIIQRCRRYGGTVPRIINLGTGKRRAASLVPWSLFYENGNLMNRRARLIVCGKQIFVPIPGTKSRFIRSSSDSLWEANICAHPWNRIPIYRSASLS